MLYVHMHVMLHMYVDNIENAKGHISVQANILSFKTCMHLVISAYMHACTCISYVQCTCMVVYESPMCKSYLLSNMH